MFGSLGAEQIFRTPYSYTNHRSLNWCTKRLRAEWPQSMTAQLCDVSTSILIQKGTLKRSHFAIQASFPTTIRNPNCNKFLAPQSMTSAHLAVGTTGAEIFCLLSWSTNTLGFKKFHLARDYSINLHAKRINQSLSLAIKSKTQTRYTKQAGGHR